MIRTFFLSLILILNCFTSRAGDISDSNFKDFIRSSKRVVVLYYSGIQVENAPVLGIFEKVRTNISQKGGFWKEISWARFDREDNPLITTELGLKSAPYLLAFEDGEWVIYAEEFYEEELEEFILRVFGDEFEPKILKNADELSEAKVKNKVAFFYGVSAAHDVAWARPLVSLLAKKHQLPAYITYEKSSSEDAFFLLLKRNFNEGDLFYSGNRPFLPLFVRSLVDSSSQRRCPIAKLATYKNLFKRKQPTIFIMDTKTDTDFANKSEDTLRRASLTIPCRVISVEFKDWNLFSRLFAISRFAVPSIGIIDYNEKKMLKYAVLHPTFETTEQFFHNYITKNLKPFYKTGSIPKTQDFPVMKVVRENFAETVIESGKDVLVCAYTRFCDQCGGIFKRVEDLAVAFGKKYPELKFAMIDTQFNDIEGVNIENLPSFFLYKKDGDGFPILLDKSFETESIDEFLKENLQGMKTEDKTSITSSEL